MSVVVDSEEVAVQVALHVAVARVTMNPSAPAGGPLDGVEASRPAHQTLTLILAHLHGMPPLARRTLTPTPVHQLGTRRLGHRTRML
jgi:hypothetical protein